MKYLFSILVLFLALAGCQRDPGPRVLPSEEPQIAVEPAIDDTPAAVTWEVTARFGITYRLVAPSHLPSGYYVEILHIDTPRIISSPYKPTVDDVDWGPNLEGFEVKTIAVKGVTVTRLH
jgi:hypothetical protein